MHMYYFIELKTICFLFVSWKAQIVGSSLFLFINLLIDFNWLNYSLKQWLLCAYVLVLWWMLGVWVGQMPCVCFLTLLWACHIIIVCYGSDCSIKMSFWILPQILFSEWKKDLDNKRKAYIVIRFVCFVTLAGKRRKEFCFLTWLRSQRCFCYYFGWLPNFFLNKLFHTSIENYWQIKYHEVALKC